MEILVVGDSWGCGEWSLDCKTILHPGLSHYLSCDGHQVYNISRGGISNQDIIFRISAWFERHDVDLDLILVFQTEYTRDFKHDNLQKDYGTDDWNIQSVTELSNRWIERFYQRLSEISISKNVPIKLIGGCSDTMAFDAMHKDYPGCDIACQSFVNLLINNNQKIENPVFSWYTKGAESLIKKLKSVLGSESKIELLEEIEKGFDRECLLKQNPEIFYPDGIHPNRTGHLILHKYLKDNNILG